MRWIDAKSLVLTALCAVAVFSTAAWAALGEDAASVQADGVHMKAALSTRSAPSYTVHELTLPGGTLVREFVSSAGKVFAVSWAGSFMPNLRQILGAYFEPYHVGAAARHAGHSRVSVSQPDLVVHSFGHARAFHGQAYLPQELPPGVTPQELR